MFTHVHNLFTHFLECLNVKQLFYMQPMVIVERLQFIVRYCDHCGYDDDDDDNHDDYDDDDDDDGDDEDEQYEQYE